MTRPFMTRLVPKSIAGRLALSAAIMISVALIVSAIAIGLVLERFIRDQIDQRLDAQIASISSALTAEDGTLRLGANVDSAPFDRPFSGWYWQVTTPTQTMRSASLAGQDLAVAYAAARRTSFRERSSRPGQPPGYQASGTLFPRGHRHHRRTERLHPRLRPEERHDRPDAAGAVAARPLARPARPQPRRRQHRTGPRRSAPSRRAEGAAGGRAHRPRRAHPARPAL